MRRVSGRLPHRMSDHREKIVRTGHATAAWSWIVVIFVLLIPAGVSAHHFKGLPHFNYFQNYPQIPQDEYMWQEGEFEFSLVIYDFQGIQKADAEQPDDARLYLVVWSLRESKIYNGPLSLRILDRGESIHFQEFSTASEENIYALQHTLPKTGRYALEVEPRIQSGPEARIPFKLSSQRVRWGKWVSGALILMVAVVAAGSRRARIIQDRRELARLRQGPRIQSKEVTHDH